MEDDATQPGSDLSREELERRLAEIEAEAARLRELQSSPDLVPVDEGRAAEAEPSQSAVEDVLGAEKELAAANVASMRGLKQEAEAHLKKAMELAPRSPAVLAAVGEDFAKRGQIKKAMEAFRQAKDADPSNPQLESRYAELVLKNAAAFDPFTTPVPTESLASAKSAVLLSAIVPGLGQLVSGQVVKGISILLGWLISWIIALAIPNGLRSLVQAAAGGASDFNTAVLFPVFTGVCFHLGAIVDATARVKAQQAHSRRIERPVPPANLPFE